MKLTKFDNQISERIIKSVIFENWMEITKQKIKDCLEDIIHGWYQFNFNISLISNSIIINFTYCPSEFKMKTLCIKVGG